MKKYLLSLFTAFICFASLQAQEAKSIPAKNAAKKAEVKTAALTQEQIQQKWTEYMTPGDMHKWLASSDGEWTSEVTMWMDPAAPPTKSTATSTSKMVLGGRYQETVFTGTVMDMPFEGRGYFGYDNSKKLFVSSWVDNMGTGIMHMEGAWNANTKTVDLKGKCTDPITGKDMKVREVITFIDDNTQKMEMFDIKDGKEVKTMEIISRRVR